MGQDKVTRRRYSLKVSLVVVVAVCVLPMVVVSTVLLYQNYQLMRQQIDQGSLLLARKVAGDLEREISAIESALKVLAVSPDLAAGDLRSFHRRATAAVGTGIVYNYVLTDAEGRQVLNTLAPVGAPLPKTGTPPQLAKVFTEGHVVLTDFFVGPVTGKPAIAMGVPVYRDGSIVYSLNIGLDPQRINEIILRQKMPEGWLVAVLDSGGTIVGRSRDSDRYTGQKTVASVQDALRAHVEGRLVSETKEGIPVYTSFVRSERWGWGVVAGAPQESLANELESLLTWVAAGTLTALLVGLWIALTVGGRVINSVLGLNRAAIDLVDGRPVHLPEIQLKEAEAVGTAILRAGQAMEQVKYLAQHDSLTGLANRLMFQELANRQFALAQRHQTTLAVVALDLDGFKNVNDTHGHAAGDQVLKIAAQRITQETRASDAVARLGGDEFMVLLCDADAETAMQTARRIVEALSQPYGYANCNVSASAGVAIFPQHGNSLNIMIAQADRALYRAKEEGRNRAIMAT